MSDQPSVARAEFPPDYGERGGDDDQPLTWREIEARLRDAPNYWLSTVTPGGRPHTRPVDGVWVDGALVFGGSPDTRWVRNMQANPAISVHLSGDDVVILDGTVALVVDENHALVHPTAAAQQAKYPQYFPPDQPIPFRPFWMLRPVVAYAWSLTGFPKRATRWTFDR